MQGTRSPTAAADLTAAPVKGLTCDARGDITLKIKLCNRGAKPAAAGTPITFFVGDPAAKKVACTATNSEPLQPGSCVEVSCVWSGAPQSTPVDVIAVADDDGTGTGSTSECEEGNNRATLKGICCANLR